jgi:hypothetical protein
VTDPTPGDEWVFADRYRVDSPIGSGGMGAVWSGYDRQLDRRVAIKLMRQSAADGFRPGAAERDALAEAAALDRSGDAGMAAGLCALVGWHVGAGGRGAAA